ncbi:RsmB/NOP family class I SAM-dependent RNA methyltransferase [Phaeobacter gallaeciensis]|uniref:RsmB/NOP family class I SAM-dependent RNA methyltransferase n=1 Tax=Phaeobacter gallaeciensis TaxID=60890 RepID=UPI00237F82A6|nr:transcription antitermination factor NusB [Phaeobacter gallaeciensis]MDE4097871.1 transcription antitermination factor NusB [Phaeobacter gallaeciensis]MDE4106870.1 transcription antitermination factor NusB [Phaeobacter gallaeciensis]MDE4111324.1 transcription antitermination factor NusB [Phaeobacter gallaeciensis]MDE4115606.1 transcription antitermination factor NusB [Phaeobacter gallaeciensis]MDE4120265.1 transcription antitermination factor NusB [Phaeobacter gallaeciensis]
MSDKAPDALQARRTTIYLLDQVLGEGRLLAECFAAGALEKLQPQDRARTQRLALEVLRSLERADRILQKHLKKKPPLTVMNALRLGTVELCSGGAAHGVVNAMVTIVSKHRRHGQLKGMVNAVLRKVADQGPAEWAKLRIPRLPNWLRKPLVQAWGAEAVLGMEAAHFAGAPLDITVKPGADLSALGGELLPTGSRRLSDAGQVSALPGYEAGDWWVQDAAAALPAQMLDVQPGERVLDLCAAPGGKTMQMAAAGAQVTAVDASAGRMERLRENLARTRLSADLIVGDALEQTGQFDAVLLDAPCSATGTIRRHPDLPHAKDGSEFGGLIELQAQMLAHAWDLVKPGGRMVFCTCSLLPDEGECQVEEALEMFPDMTADRECFDGLGTDPAWITEEGGLRLRPDYWADRGSMDGFYMALLRKAG